MSKENNMKRKFNCLIENITNNINDCSISKKYISFNPAKETKELTKDIYNRREVKLMLEFQK